jgi:hypothetical protein
MARMMMVVVVVMLVMDQRIYTEMMEGLMQHKYTKFVNISNMQHRKQFK